MKPRDAMERRIRIDLMRRSAAGAVFASILFWGGFIPTGSAVSLQGDVIGTFCASTWTEIGYLTSVYASPGQRMDTVYVYHALTPTYWNNPQGQWFIQHSLAGVCQAYRTVCGQLQEQGLSCPDF